MKDFRKLKVWERAHQFVLAVYQTTASFPRDETYGLTTQIRRILDSIQYRRRFVDGMAMPS